MLAGTLQIDFMLRSLVSICRLLLAFQLFLLLKSLLLVVNTTITQLLFFFAGRKLGNKTTHHNVRINFHEAFTRLYLGFCQEFAFTSISKFARITNE